MQFRIADAFTASLTCIPAQNQQATKVTVFDIQADPTAHELRSHRVDRSPEPSP